MRTSAPGGSGRYLDVAGALDNPLQGLALNWSLHPSLASANVPVAAVSAVDEYDFWARGVWGDVEQRMLEAIGTFPPVPDPAVEGGRGDAAGRDPALATPPVRRRQLGDDGDLPRE